MRSRRLPVVAVLLIGLAALVVVGSDRPGAVDPVFGLSDTPTQPFVPAQARTTESWYCPGVPASGDGVSGEVIIANQGDEPLNGRYTVLSVDAPAVIQPFEVGAFATTVLPISDGVSSPFVSALVEFDEGSGIVEQRAVHPAGASIAPCANAPSASWYFADGFTIDGSTQQLVLTNPFPGRAILSLRTYTQSGARTPAQFDGFVVPGRSVRVIDVAEAGARDEPVLAVAVEVTRGRVVAGRSQHFASGGRLGYSMTLGAPALDDQWWFADGETGDGISESYRIYNPTDETVQADLVFLGLQLGENDAPPDAITLQIGPGEAVSYDTSEAGLPQGRHGAVVSTLASDSVVVERVLTRPAGDLVATTVQMGSQSAFSGNRWHVPTGADLELEQALVVLNVSFTPGTITVNAFGPGGEQPVPGLEGIELPANGVVALDLTDPSVVGEHLVVTTDVPVVVERRPERSPELRGRSSALGLPEF